METEDYIGKKILLRIYFMLKMYTHYNSMKYVHPYFTDKETEVKRG